MWLECTCEDIGQDRWDELMKGSRPLNYKWLVRKIKKELPDLYESLRLDLYNPYWQWTRVTKTHYILVSSSIEYFINKGENPYSNEDDDYPYNGYNDDYPQTSYDDEYNVFNESKIRKIIIEEINKIK